MFERSHIWLLIFASTIIFSLEPNLGHSEESKPVVDSSPNPSTDASSSQTELSPEDTNFEKQIKEAGELDDSPSDEKDPDVESDFFDEEAKPGDASENYETISSDEISKAKGEKIEVEKPDPSYIPPRVYLGGGAFVFNLKGAATTKEGHLKRISHVYSQAGGMVQLHLYNRKLWMEPYVYFTFVSRKLEDGDISSSIFLLGSPFAYRFFNRLDVKFGTGFLFYVVNGAGGAAILNNGTSKSTFALPDKAAISRSLMMDAGIGVNLGDFRIDIDAIVISVLNINRITNVMGNLSYGL